MGTTLQGTLADRSRWQATECSIAKAMDVIGSRSAMLIVREAWYGTTRFDDFARRAGLTDAVTASRLKQLVELGVLAKRPYREPGKRTRHEYVLTTMGRDLLPAVVALMQWGDKHLQRDGGPLNLIDRNSGMPVTVGAATPAGTPVNVDDVIVTANHDWVESSP